MERKKKKKRLLEYKLQQSQQQYSFLRYQFKGDNYSVIGFV